MPRVEATRRAKKAKRGNRSHGTSRKARIQRMVLADRRKSPNNSIGRKASPKKAELAAMGNQRRKATPRKAILLTRNSLRRSSANVKLQAQLGAKSLDTGPKDPRLPTMEQVLRTGLLAQKVLLQGRETLMEKRLDKGIRKNQKKMMRRRI